MENILYKNQRKWRSGTQILTFITVGFRTTPRATPHHSYPWVEAEKLGQ